MSNTIQIALLLTFVFVVNAQAQSPEIPASPIPKPTAVPTARPAANPVQRPERDTTRTRPVVPADSPEVTERLRRFRENTIDPNAPQSTRVPVKQSASMRPARLYCPPHGPLEINIRRGVD